MTEKTFTPDEARDALMKATKERLDGFAKELEVLKARELKKALIPNHKHNPGTQAGAGTEDVPPGKANPKGTAKSAPIEASGTPTSPMSMDTAKAEDKPDREKIWGDRARKETQDKKDKKINENHSKEQQKVRNGTSGKPWVKSEACEKCGEMHGLEKCGEMKVAKEEIEKAVDKVIVHKPERSPKPVPPDADHTVRQEKGKTIYETKKSDLVDAKGNKKDNHTVAGSKNSDVDPKHVNKPGKTAKTAGSGGAILPGAGLKKSNPPMAKPPSGVNMGTSVPTSAPKTPKPAMKADLEKGVMADVVQRESKHAGAPVPPPAPVKLPTQTQHADRQAHFAQAMSGAFQPPFQPPAAAKPLAQPPAKPALKPASAGPVVNAARPIPPLKPGIFGRLMGRK